MTKEIYWCCKGQRLLICERNGMLVAVWKPETNKGKIEIVTTENNKKGKL